MTLYLRVFVLWLARQLGALRHWLLGDWRFLILGFAASAEILWVADALAGAIPATASLLSTRFLALDNALALYVVTLLGHWIWNVRQRVVVDEFVNHTPEVDKTPSKGLSALLVSDLMRFGALHRAIDERRTIQTAVDVREKVGPKEQINPAIRVEDLGESLRGLVSAEVTLAIGPVQLPVGALMAIAGKLLQGPRIIGNLHRAGDTFIVTAQLVGGSRALSWRVEQQTKPGGEDVSRVLAQAVEELATRILRDISFGGAVPWKAVAAFMNGLREYRDCLRTPKDRNQHLRNAAQAFTQAIAEDDAFDLAYYNLGVVYSELDQIEAAEAALLTAIGINAERWSAYYALADRRFQRAVQSSSQPTREERSTADFRSVVELCTRVIGTSPEPIALAEAWNLRGRAERRIGDSPAAMASLRRAVYITWKALLSAEYLGLRYADPTAMAKLSELAAVCLRNLAVVTVESAHSAAPSRARALRHAGIRLHRRALWRRPSDADLLYEIGKAYAWMRDYARAVAAVQAAAEIAPRSLLYWSELAWCAAHAHMREIALRACSRVLECPSEAMRLASRGKTTLDVVAEAYAALGDHAEAARIEAMLPLAREMEKEAARESPDKQKLERELPQFQGDGREWERGKILYELGQICLKEKDYVSAEKHTRDAMACLASKHPDEIVWLGLRTVVARALRLQKRYSEALVSAEAAVACYPLRVFEWEELIEVQLALGDFTGAIRTCHEAVVWKPNDPGINAKLVIAHWRLALDLRDPVARRANLDAARRYLNDALDGYGSADQSGKRWAHYWLGRLHYDLGEMAQAVAHFRVVETATEDDWVLTGPFWLGFAYLDDKNYYEARRYFDRVRKKSLELIAAGVSPQKKYGPDYGQMALNAILSSACAGIGNCYAEPGIKLDDALALAQESRAHAAGIEDADAREACLAYAAYCHGIIYERQGALEHAIDSFEQAVALEQANAIHFLRLASALANALDGMRAAQDQRRAISRARICLEQVAPLDWRSEHAEAMNRLRARLDDKEAKIPAPPASRPTPAATALGTGPVAVAAIGKPGRIGGRNKRAS